MAVVRPRRDPGRPVAWALPKGLIDPPERGLETAVREVFEETGLRAAGDRKLGDVRYVYTWEGVRVFKVVSFFLLHATGGRIGELPLDDAPRFLSYGGEREMAARAAETLAEGSM